MFLSLAFEAVKGIESRILSTYKAHLFSLLQVWWAASDLGWVVGHSYICYGPLLHGNSTILYEVRPLKQEGIPRHVQ